MFETGKLRTFLPKNYKLVDILKISSSLLMMTLTVLLSNQLIIIDKQATFLAITFSIAPILISIYFGLIIVEDELKIKKASKTWHEIRNVTRISYVFHPLIYSTIKMMSPNLNFENFNLVVHFLSVISTDLLISLTISIYYEKPLFNFIFNCC